MSLGGYYTKTGGSLESSSATLSLNDNTTIASDTAIDFNQLELNDLTLTLADANTDLQISSAVTMDNPNEFIITGDADLTMLSTLNISAGGVTSTAGTLSFQGGGQLTGSGTIDFTESTWVTGSSIIKHNGGSFVFYKTNLSLGKDTTLQSDQAINIASLELNGFILTLGDNASDLTVAASLIIDESTEGISTGDADLILKSALIMSDGILQSAGGIIMFAKIGRASCRERV